MPTPPLSDDLARQAGEAYLKHGEVEGARVLGIPLSRFSARVRVAVDRGIISRKDRTGGTNAPSYPKAAATPKPDVRTLDTETLRTMLLRAPSTLDEVSTKLRCTRGAALDAIEGLRSDGMNVQQFGDRWSIDKTPAPQHVKGEIPTYHSRPDGTYLFGFTSDNHLGSKYARLDVLEDLYTQFANQGVDRVFNAGNWIDGEARFNKHDLLVHGMDAQIRYLVKNYPQRQDITTYAVAGDDHEGWYCQNSGIDIGRHAESAMRKAGREDWVDLGYMEAYVRLVDSRSGESSMLHVIHPGGGTAYAISYTVQKIAESYDGGDKPAVALVGHYHKMGYNPVRNVHMIQTGTTEDQTPFMRKKKLAAHVGGGVCQLRQDPRTGAIQSCRVEFFNYFNRGYANGRWNMSDDVVLADRGA